MYKIHTIHKKSVLKLESEIKTTSYFFINSHPFIKYGESIVQKDGAFFVRKRDNMSKYIPKIIYCPKCGRKCGTYDGKSTIDKVCRCKKCNKRIVYHVNTGEIERKDIPERNCSSGMIFV